MNDFRNTLRDFRDAVREEGDRSRRPNLQTLLHREQAKRTAHRRWAFAGAVALIVAAIPFWQRTQQRQRAAADTELLRQVNAGLSRSIPQAMAPLMRWTPDERKD